MCYYIDTVVLVLTKGDRSLLDERNIPSETEEINVTVNKYSDEYMFVVNFLSNKISIQALRYKSHVIMTARGSDWKPVENMGQFTDPSGKFFKIVLPAQPTRF